MVSDSSSESSIHREFGLVIVALRAVFIEFGLVIVAFLRSIHSEFGLVIVALRAVFIVSLV